MRQAIDEKRQEISHPRTVYPVCRGGLGGLVTPPHPPSYTFSWVFVQFWVILVVMLCLWPPELIKFGQFFSSSISSFWDYNIFRSTPISGQENGGDLQNEKNSSLIKGVVSFACSQILMVVDVTWNRPYFCHAIAWESPWPTLGGIGA